MDKNRRLVFEVEYEWHRLDSHGKPVGAIEVSFVLCDSIDDALKEHAIWLESTRNEVKSHRWPARQNEAGSCSIHPIYINEELEYLDDAWDELSADVKEKINNSYVEFFGRDL